MLYLAIIFHMHQPYYKNLLTQETDAPWVRLHGTKDYLDMVQILEKFPAIHQTFNLVPSLLEQVEDYCNRAIKDKFLELSFKPAQELTSKDKAFILERFFSINVERVISQYPRYYELYFKHMVKKEFTTQDFLDLQLLFNLVWIDPVFRKQDPRLTALIYKGRFFSEEEKAVVLNKQIEILQGIIPGYKKAIESGQIEVTVSPYYHPILPLLCSTNSAREANRKAALPRIPFAYPEDAAAQIEEAGQFFQERFGKAMQGMWPSEESVSESILPFLLNSKVKWIVADEAILFKSRKVRKRDTALLYQPHVLKRKQGEMNIIFRDRNLSDLIGFTYFSWKPEAAAVDLMQHLNNIEASFKDKDILVTIAMDGENAWEYFVNDGHDFLEIFYQKLSESKTIKAVTVSEYLNKFGAQSQIKHLAAGSWIFAEFGKWIGNPFKVRGWEMLAEARKEFEQCKDKLPKDKLKLAWKQMYIVEGSDWFWWFGEDPGGNFDKLFRMHMSNFYTIIGKPIPEYLQHPIHP